MTIARKRIVISAHLLVGAFAACDVVVPLAGPTESPRLPVEIDVLDAFSDRCQLRRSGNSRVLARAQNRMGEMIIDDHHIYWVDSTPSSSSILRIDKNGGEPQVVGASLFMPHSIVMDHEAIYCLTRDNPPQLVRLPKTGGAATTLAVGIRYVGGGLAVDDQYVYLSDISSIERVPKMGGARQVLYQPIRPVVQGLAVDDHHVYFVDMSGSVRSIAKASGQLVEFAPSLGSGKVATGDGYVYWIAVVDTQLFRAASTGGPPVALVPGTFRFFDFAIVSDRIYFPVSGWFDSEVGGIYQIDLNSGDIEMLVGGDCGYQTIAVDATTVYYTNSRDGTVNAIPRRSQ